VEKSLLVVRYTGMLENP